MHLLAKLLFTQICRLSRLTFRYVHLLYVSEFSTSKLMIQYDIDGIEVVDPSLVRIIIC